MSETRFWKRTTQWRNDSYRSEEKNDLATIKDWLEIFQYQLGVSNDSMMEKVGREKLKFRISQEFI